MYKYIIEKEDTYGLNKLQDKILEIVVYFDKFCRENNIQYFLMGGSALGAMRHKGFIPWDDDFDVFMTYDNYIRFMEVVSEKLDTEHFYLQKENTDELPFFFSKIRMNGTTFIESNTTIKERHQGIYIDIMCLNRIPNSKLMTKIQYYRAAKLRTYALVKSGYNADTFIKKLALKYVKIFITAKKKEKLLKKVRKYNSTDTLRYGHFFGRAKLPNACYPVNCFKEARYVPFEKLMLPVPQGVEEYLTIRFGENYMQMPDAKTKAIYKSHVEYWNTEVGYEEYNANEKI